MIPLKLSQCRGHLCRLQRLKESACQPKLFSSLVTKTTVTKKTNTNKEKTDDMSPINEFGVPMISNKLRSKLFSKVSVVKRSEAASKQVGFNRFITLFYSSI